MLWLKIVIIYIQFPELSMLKNTLVRSVLTYVASMFTGHRITKLFTSDEGPDEFKAVSSKGHVWIYCFLSPTSSNW